MQIFSEAEPEKRQDGIFLGTTWMQQIVWLICNNADVEKAKSERLLGRYGFLEIVTGTGFGEGFQTLEKWPQTKRR